MLKLPIGRSVQEVFRNLSNLVARVSYVGQYGTTVVKNCLQLSLARQKYTQLYFNNFELSFQIAEGDVCRGLRIPIYMIFPRLFTCPTLTTANFKIGQLSTYNKNHKRRQDFTESQSKANFFSLFSVIIDNHFLLTNRGANSQQPKDPIAMAVRTCHTFIFSVAMGVVLWADGLTSLRLH